MALRITPSQAYERGRVAALTPFCCGDFMVWIDGLFKTWRQTYPLSAHLDYAQEIARHWQERLDAGLDLTRYPECRGLADVVRAEFRGFADACGNPVHAALHYDWHHYCTTRLGPRYFGFPPELRGRTDVYREQAAECTAVWIEDSPDGPLQAKNLDTCPSQQAGPEIPCALPAQRPRRGVHLVGTASASILYDEEPTEIFPVKLDDIYPEDIRTVRDHVAFLERYRQFGQPGNRVWVDEEGHAVSTESSNCRFGYRFAERGIAAVTALAYRTPELQAFKRERDLLSLEKRGWDQTSPDWCYWQTCEVRYDRLLALTAALARSGPTLAGLARVMLDPDGPLPARISTANEPFHPEVPTDLWTMYTWVAAPLAEPPRTYWWRQPARPTGPIFKLAPEQLLPPGTTITPQLAAEHRALAAIGK